MFTYANLVRKTILLGVFAATTAVIAPATLAQPTPVDPAAVMASITKQRAEAIALQAVGGGTVLLALLERDNGSVHWSVDIRGATNEYEVWVSTQGKVLKTITQPL